MPNISGMLVRLHEDDRDATRFLWSDFGLVSSPFLLPANINFHLETTDNDKVVASEIKDNLYVDNLVMTAETKEEALKQYKESRKIFNDLNMNAKEFATNSEEVKAKLAEGDRNSSETPKVLGIEWNIKEDKLVIKCVMQATQKITKRMVWVST
ncbi:hypothetical protein OESDEN_02273 [Oesophagostomum dentatum]|uniref:Reverse transcriptase domain-containing protein n=1 Tax=Oesophagostomum dentatum TaxID=61180 RepID=A0A0B1TQS5_OESDE|nr:hypothetical protein OESDEN_02273 [Oesophagostomum dentatum]